MGRIYNISSSLNFSESLATGILQRFEDIENITIYLPSKRAIKTVSEAFLKVSGKPAMLLPNMQAIGDIDDDELEISPKFEALNKDIKPISKTRRLLEVATLLEDKKRKFTQNMRLGKSLITLIDEMQNNGIEWKSFENIVPEEFAQHWQITLDFLKVASVQWQKKLAQEGVTEPVIYRNNIINILADYYAANPPTHPVIVAGSTGSVPATANFIKQISALENGYVVLFGLDSNLTPNDHKELEETHPQYLLTKLLFKLNANIADVESWQKATLTLRQQLISTSLFPTHKTTQWAGQNLVSDIELAEFGHIEDEATAIALILREVLEGPQNAMLVTHNRQLAARVAAKMKIWNVEINDSAGQPLLNTVSANFLILMAELFVNKFAPVDVLAFFKHPYIPKEIKSELRAGEVKNYHKPRKLMQPPPPMQIDKTEFAKFFEENIVNLKQLLSQHLQLAEITTDKLWHHEGADLKDLIDETLDAINDDFLIDPIMYPEFLRIVFASKTYRPKFGQHPRINIFSPIEARLQNADVVILADMNEGSFPQVANADSFTNQKIRRDVGLDLPQKKIGQNAHDYELLTQNPRVILTRSTKISGSPTTKSRFWQRLEAVSNAAITSKYNNWLQKFNEPAKFLKLERPAPKPPASARPNTLSATKISKLIRDPYTIYAEKILRLKKIDDVDRELSAADFGNFVHEAFEQFAKNYDGKLETLLAYGKESFKEFENYVGAKAFWWSKFERISGKFIQLEQARRAGQPIILEETSEVKIGGFTLTAKADRIENCPDGLKIIDYKTGTPPSKKYVEKGLEPQLAIEAIIFEKYFEKQTISLEYWHLKGKDEIIKIEEHDVKVIAEAKQNLPLIIAKMQDENNPFIARPWSYYALPYNDYEHLERIKEWS